MEDRVALAAEDGNHQMDKRSKQCWAVRTQAQEPMRNVLTAADVYPNVVQRRPVGEHGSQLKMDSENSSCEHDAPHLPALQIKISDPA